MNKETTIKELLEHIKLSEGDGFNYDETAILNAYEKDKDNQSSLAIKILSILGGFLATCAFVVFLLVVGFYKTEFGLFVLGACFIVLAIGLNRKYDKLIIDTFSVSLYATGILLFSFGLAEMSVNQKLIAVFVIVIASVSLFITQNYLLSFLSVLAICGGFLSIVMDIEIMNVQVYDLIHLYIGGIVILMTYWLLNESKIITQNYKLSKLYEPVRIGLMISLLFGLMVVGNKNLIEIELGFMWISSIIIISTIMYLIHIIMKINKVEAEKSKILIYTLSFLILVSTLFSPSISGAFLILLLSFLVNYKTGLAIGIIALIYFISQFYYNLNFTLLTKSIILFSSGVLFLIAYLFINKKTISNEAI